MVVVVSAFPPPEVPLTPTRTPLKRGFKRWPLWVKIAAPIGTLLVVGGIGNALSPKDESNSTRPLAAVETTLVEESEVVVDITSAPTTTIEMTTVATTVQPTTLPVTTPPTTPVSVAPIAAPVPPPTQPATTPAPTNPPPPTAAATDPRFDTCKEAKANGYGPYRSGVDPEYNWYRDADSDGIVCE